MFYVVNGTPVYRMGNNLQTLVFIPCDNHLIYRFLHFNMKFKTYQLSTTFNNIQYALI
jgi:hypothetical protein